MQIKCRNQSDQQGLLSCCPFSASGLILWLFQYRSLMMVDTGAGRCLKTELHGLDFTVANHW